MKPTPNKMNRPATKPGRSTGSLVVDFAVKASPVSRAPKPKPAPKRK